jgi:nucleotide-binding universal stress UspA family protein
VSTIVVGVDGSDASKEALRWAAEEARLRGASLRAIHAWSYPIGAAGLGLMPPVDAEARETVERAAQEMAQRALAEADVDASRLDADAVAVEGMAADVLVRAAAGADLLVVGSRGHGGFAGLLLGSVSQQCAQHAPCPVVIVRDGASSAER